MSGSNCCFLTCIQEAGKVVWYSHLFKNFSQFIVIHTVKDFGVVNKADADIFLELSCFFNDPADVGNLISSSSAFSKTSLNIWKFTVHILLKPYCCCCCLVALVVFNSVRPQRWQRSRLPRPWDSPGKNTGVGCHFLLQCVKVKSLSCVRLSATPWTAAYQAPPSMGFSRQEYWSGVPLPSPVTSVRDRNMKFL